MTSLVTVRPLSHTWTTRRGVMANEPCPDSKFDTTNPAKQHVEVVDHPVLIGQHRPRDTGLPSLSARPASQVVVGRNRPSRTVTRYGSSSVGPAVPCERLPLSAGRTGNSRGDAWCLLRGLSCAVASDCWAGSGPTRPAVGLPTPATAAAVGGSACAGTTTGAPPAASLDGPTQVGHH